MAASLTVRRRPVAIDPPGVAGRGRAGRDRRDGPAAIGKRPGGGQPANAAETTSRASDCTCLRCSGPLNDSA